MKFLGSIFYIQIFLVSGFQSMISRSRNRITLYSSNYSGSGKESFILKEFSQQTDLEDIVKLASAPLPERPDGIVTVAKYSSTTRENCRSTEDQYEQLARKNPATLFLRCFEEYENASMLIANAQITVFPTYDVFYLGNRVARVEGNIVELEKVLNNFQMLKSKLDLFSESADNERRLAWGDGKIQGFDGSTPRTTARFIPGYDWNVDRGAFDQAAQKAEDDFDDYWGNWSPEDK